jgi:arylformamidase
MRIHDISQQLGRHTAAWPGDRAFELEWVQRLDAGDAVNVAAIALSVHTGTHADGRFHFQQTGERAAGMPLEAYVGEALLIDATGRRSLGEELLDGVPLDGVERVLFRSRAEVDESRFPGNFAHVEPALARRLAVAGVRLLGTDAPSVDPVDSKSLDAHRILGAGGIAILENLVLADVAPGRYFLVALPLRLVEADSSPVRAVLIEGLKT